MLVSVFIAVSLHEPTAYKKRNEGKRYFDILNSGFSYLYHHKILWILAIDFSFIYLMGYFVLWFYQKKLLLLGLDIAFFGFVHLFFTFSQIIFISFSQKLENILKSKKRLLFLTAFLVGLLLIVLGLSSNLYLVIISIILIGAFSLGRKPLFSNYFNQQITFYERATVLSALSMIQKMFLFISAPIFGYFADFSLNYVFVFLGVITVIVAFSSRIKEEHLIN